jgi:RHS repeat-associated protein
MNTVLPRIKILVVLFLALLSQSAYAQSVSYQSLYDNTNFGKTIHLSNPVGTIDGTAGTTPSGATTYSIPIKCPPGTHGMIPNLSVVYNSQNGNGLLGQGWNLSGLSVISRSGKNLYHDNKVSPVTYTNDDAFLMDGVHLSPVTGSNGANGTIYRSESENYSVTTSYGSVGGGPQYFKVVSKDGTIMEFGNTTDSRTMTNDGSAVMIWRLNKIQDVNGNYMTFIYTNNNNSKDIIYYYMSQNKNDNDGRDVQLAEIDYTGNANTGLTPYNSIKFSYVVRTDKHYFYDGGSSVTSRYLLDNITTYSEGDQVNKYAFSYAFENVKSYLKNITEYAQSSSTALEDTRFMYQELEIGPVTVTSNIGAYWDNSTTTLNADIFSGDFDGDGKTEILKAQYYYFGTYASDDKKNYKGFTIYKADASGTPGSYSPLPGGSDSWTSDGRQLMTLRNDGNKSKNFVASDFDGDGKDDLLFMKTQNTSDGLVYNGVSIYYSRLSSTGFNFDIVDYPAAANAEICPTISSDSNIIDGKNNMILGDFDGDKRTDYMYVSKSVNMCSAGPYAGYPIYTNHVFVSFPGKGLINLPIMNSDPAYSSSYDYAMASNMMTKDIYVLDFDGDGKSDIMYTNGSFNYVYTLEQTSTGKYYFKLIESGGYPTEAYHTVMGVGDFNGDGKDDILTKSKVADLWEIGFSTGGGVQGFDGVEFKFQTGAEFQSDCSWSGGSAVSDLLFIGDFNGDGKSDILHERSHCGTDYNAKIDYNVYYLRGFDGGITNIGNFETRTLYDFQSYTNFARPSNHTDRLFTDVDGDGRREISFRTLGDYTQYMQTVYFKKGGRPNLLQKVTDGYNRTTEFNYQPLTAGTGSGSFYTKGTGSTYPLTNGQYPIYVVTSMQSPDGIGGNNITNYSYENMLLHRAGRGLLGFEKVISTNLNANLRTESTNGINTDFYAMYPKTIKTFLNSTGGQLSQTDNTISFNRIGTGYCFNQQATSSTLQDLLKGLTTVSTNTYDGSGNVTNTTSTTTGGSETFTTSTETTYTAVGSSPIPNKPSAFTVTSQRGSQPSVATRTIIIYDAIGQSTRTFSYPTTTSSTLSIAQNYTYDNYGNVVSDFKTSFSGVPTSLLPVISYEYDSKGRFPVKTTNPYGDISYQTYHKFWGKPLSATGLDGMTATYTYDNWGKLTSSYTPTLGGGYTVNYSYGWDILGNQLYYTLVQNPGSPDTKTWYDHLGRAIKVKKETFGSSWTTAITTYDARGNVDTSTNNYLVSETPFTTTNSYDALNRISSSTNPFGTTSYAYSSGSGQATTTVTEPDGKIKITTTDAIGKVLKSSNDIAGAVFFTYDSRGNEINTQIGASTGGPVNPLITKQYDDWGRLISMKDPDAGTTTFTYNTLGELISQTDPKGKVTTYVYNDVMGKLTQKNLDGYMTTYTYYGPTKGYQIQQTQVTSAVDGTITDNYDYNVGGTLNHAAKTTNGVTLEKNYEYDAYNRLISTTYVNSGFGETREYDANGYLLRIWGGSTIAGPGGTLPLGRLLYEATSINGNGQVTGYNRVNGLASTTDYYNGIVTGYTTPGVQKLVMSYADYSNGDMTGRDDQITYTKETFTYDKADRLTQSAPQKYGSPTATYIPINITYDNNWWGSLGRILAKTDAGNYGYSGFPRNAVLSITDPMNNVSHAEQDIVYTPFHKTSSITETIDPFVTAIPYIQKYVYDANEDRAYSEQTQGGTTAIQRWYMGDYERAYNTATGTKDIHYISGAEGICGIVVGNATTGFNYYAVYTDHLGSIVTVTDAIGTVVAHQSYDAWGRERNPDTWDYAMIPTKPDWLYRGYTGHEMLPEFDLINMNGRMYDPINGRMMRPDNLVKAPDNTQSYNRYSYCMNNPIKYVDPDGNNPVVAAVVIATVISSAMYAYHVSQSDGGFKNWDWFNFTFSAVQGGISGFMGYGIGSAFSAATIGGSVILNETTRAAAHGLSSYIMSGGDNSAFWAGAFGSAAGSFSGGQFGRDMGFNTTVGGTALAAAVGGTASVIGGGNFWEGAAIGATVHLVNHVFHNISLNLHNGSNQLNPYQLMEHYMLGNGEDYAFTKNEFESLIYELDQAGKININGFLPIAGTDGFLYKEDVSTYGTPFANACGSITLYATKETIVGYSDWWNFDAQSSGQRSQEAELKTTIGRNIPGKPFWVLYGLTPDTKYIPKR